MTLGFLVFCYPLQVGPGEVLYLPSMWYHQVGQREAPATTRQQQQQLYGSIRQQQYGINSASAQGPDGKAWAEEEEAEQGPGTEEEGASTEEEEEQEYVIAVNYWWVYGAGVRRTARSDVRGRGVVVRLCCHRLTP